MPSEVRAFHTWMRQAFAQFIQERAEGGLTNGEQIIRTVILRAKDGDMKAIEYVLDRMAGKPLQSVEVGAELSFNFLSEADRIRAIESVERIRRMRGEGDPKRQGIGRTLALLPSASECNPYGSASPVKEPAIVPTKRKAHCIHGFAVTNSAASHCVACSNLGLQIKK